LIPLCLVHRFEPLNVMQSALDAGSTRQGKNEHSTLASGRPPFLSGLLAIQGATKEMPNPYELKELANKRARLYTEARSVLDVAYNAKRELTAEETAKYDKITGEADSIHGTIERCSKQMAEERALAESMGRKSDSAMADPVHGEVRKLRNQAMKAWALRGTSHEGLAFAAECERLGIDVRKISDWKADSIEQRALSVGTTTAGGNAVPDERMGSLYESQKFFGNVRAKSLVIKTESGASFPVPTVTDTANSGSITSEGGTIASNVDPTFGQIAVGAYKYVSPIIKVSIELLRDASFDLNGFLVRMLGIRLARKQNADFTTGNGTTAPQGYITGGTTGVTAAATNAITMDEVIDLEESLDPAYADGAEIFSHQNVIKALRKLKDGANNYLWQPSNQLGTPGTLHGINVNPNNDMASSIATGAKTMAYANLGLAYLIRDVGESMFSRSDQIYWETQQVGFLAAQWSDAKVLDSAAIKLLVQA